MSVRLRGFAACLVMMLCAWTAALSSQPPDRHARGSVVDESDGVLPGVTVVATAPDGTVLATTVTDGAGRYAAGPLPPGSVTLTFQLEGFSPVTVAATIKPDADAVVNQRLALAPRSETVVVVGKIPVP